MLRNCAVQIDIYLLTPLNAIIKLIEPVITDLQRCLCLQYLMQKLVVW